MKRSMRKIFGMAACAASLATTPLGGAYASDSGYVQTNLISNNTSIHAAAHEDKSLLNPWGVVFPTGGPFWINDNNAGLSALYNGNGTGVNGTDPALAVTIPPPNGGTPPAAPTGIVWNTSSTFKLNDGKAASFIFATEDGTISAWDGADGIPGTAELKVDNSTEKCSDDVVGAVYKGLAQGETTAGVFLYATNFRCGTIDVFNGAFSTPNPPLSGNFQDPQIPAGFAPFGIADVGGDLVVTYAKQNAQKHDDVAGAGNGFVDVFDTNGDLIERFAARGKLNSPWGIVRAPFDFGKFSNDLLVGNFGDGRINAFKIGGEFQGQLRDVSNRTIAIDGLWSLIFGGGSLSSPDTLYFTSGPDGETNGLVGTLTPQ